VAFARPHRQARVALEARVGGGEGAAQEHAARGRDRAGVPARGAQARRGGDAWRGPAHRAIPVAPAPRRRGARCARAASRPWVRAPAAPPGVPTRVQGRVAQEPRPRGRESRCARVVRPRGRPRVVAGVDPPVVPGGVSVATPDTVLSTTIRCIPTLSPGRCRPGLRFRRPRRMAGPARRPDRCSDAFPGQHFTGPTAQAVH
jgi:hypothetical protein